VVATDSALSLTVPPLSQEEPLKTAKQAVVTLYEGSMRGPLLTMTNPADKLLIVTHPERISPEMTFSP
jgi:hypothetical protein